MRVGHGAIEFDGEMAVLRGGQDSEPLAVPAGSGDGQGSGVGIQFLVERTLDGPIVREAEGGPLRIVKIGALGIGAPP